MSVTWKRVVPHPEDHQRVYELLKNPLLEEAVSALLDLLESEEISKETSTSQYDKPSWAYAQADRNGAKRAYRKLRSLFNLNKES